MRGKSSALEWKPVGLWPRERKVVLVWLRDKCLPFCGYMRYAAGDRDSPYFVVYHGNVIIGADVVAWCDCLPELGPEWIGERKNLYESDQMDHRRMRKAGKPPATEVQP